MYKYFIDLDEKKILKYFRIYFVISCILQNSKIPCNYIVIQLCEIMFYFLFSPMKSFKE